MKRLTARAGRLVVLAALASAAAMPGASGAEAPAAPVSAGGEGAQDLLVEVTGLRSGKGEVLACLSADRAAFPDCSGHASARHVTVAAHKGAVILDFGPVPPGTYAISLFHDENRNGKLDTVLKIPREGYGFSRDAPVRMGPPRYAAAAFAVGAGPVRQTVKMRYLF